MDDLISRREAVNALENNRFLGAPYVNTGILIAKRIIEELPSAQPEIIRCKDCKHNMKSSEAGNACCDIFYGMTDQNGFCHMGERRKDG